MIFLSTEYTVFSINGPVVTVRGKTDLKMLELVRVGRRQLSGEVIGIGADSATIQVYEDTSGMKPGEPVVSTGGPMSAVLGPGIMKNIYDGIQNPLLAVAEQAGNFITRGIKSFPLDENALWDVEILVKPGDRLKGGDCYARCPETPVVMHKILLHPLLAGEVADCKPSGRYRVNDTIATLKDSAGRLHELTLCHTWPIKKARPVNRRLPLTRPLITGQRIVDTLYPVAKGGAAVVPGGFGTGKTVTQHQLAKWCDADIIIYVGCGERGNEMTQALREFAEITDPRTGSPLTNRTVLIANTSNMPVAAREASIYTGITTAEYYRDMGYHTALFADSTSRWAEALREISGRLEEMPAEEGFPAYLPSRLSEFYERAGLFELLTGETGSVTAIGAVSPQGSDFSEPVTQNTKRFTRCFWALDKNLAYARHFPAINWTDSYSEYLSDLSAWYDENVGADFVTMRNRMYAILLDEKELMDIVKLIGADVLPDEQRLIIETARVIRIGFLQQDATNPMDTSVPLIKQLGMMRCMITLYDTCVDLIKNQVPLSKITATGLFDKTASLKQKIPNDKPEMFDDFLSEIRNTLRPLAQTPGEVPK